jgi:multisubunit Na+/H+ antiporter MnhC subunit
MISIFGYLFLFVGTVVIWRSYRKASGQDRLQIEHFSGLELMKRELLLSKSKVAIYRTVSWIALFNLVAVYVQLRFQVIEGWATLAILGVSVTLSVYLIGEIERISYQNEWQRDNDDLKALEKEKVKRAEMVQNLLKSLLLVSIAIGYLAYQDQNTEKENQFNAVEVALELQGKSFCGEYSGVGSAWPCIYVGDLQKIGFQEVDGKESICGSYSFNFENGLPGERSFSLYSDFHDFCVPESDSSGWTKYVLEDLVDQYLKTKLDSLTVNLCQKYYLQLDARQKFVYCN